MHSIQVKGHINLRLTYITISKILFALYVVYSQALYYTKFYIPRIPTVLIALCLFTYLFGTGKIFKEKYSLYYIGFLLYSLTTGVVLGEVTSPFLMSIRNLAEYFLSFYLIYVYSVTDNSISFVSNVFVLLAIVMSGLNFTMGQGINRITFSENLNVNTIAIVMMFGIGFVLFNLIREKVSLYKWIAGFSVIALFMYMILITVSKKAILGSGFLIAFWTLWCSGKDNKRGRVRKILIFFFVMFALYYGYELFVRYMPAQYEYFLLRMSQLSEGTSSSKRRELIKQGFDVFLQNPIFGVGLNNFRYYTIYNTYSHCFYSELFACLGIIGVFIFFIPFFLGVLSLIKRIRFSNSLIYRNRIKYIMAILICLMGTSIAQIIFYEYELIYILGVICASRCIYDLYSR